MFSSFQPLAATNKLYGCVVDMSDNLVRKTDGGFDVNEYFSHPELYASNFARKVRISSIFRPTLQGVYWFKVFLFGPAVGSQQRKLPNCKNDPNDFKILIIFIYNDGAFVHDVYLL